VRAGVDFSECGSGVYDAESLITELEVSEGLSYDNSHREWMNEATYLKACSGELTPEQIMYLAPRVENVVTLSDATGHYA
jgi:hypothetical protein